VLTTGEHKGSPGDAGHKDEVPRGTDLAVPESNCGELVLQAVKEDDKSQGSRNAA